MTVKLDKHNLKNVASLLCGLKMVHGSNSEEYTLTDEFKTMTPDDLISELRARKHLIKPKRDADG